MTPLAQQFDEPGRQRRAAMLGVWVFLATEVLLFGALLTAYTVYRRADPHAFAEASSKLYGWIAVLNTAVLLASSCAMAAAVHGPHARARRRVRLLTLTAALGASFLLIKAVEYALDLREHLLPGPGFDAAPFRHPQAAELFLFFYWFLTGLHALHVAGGVALITGLTLRLRTSHRPESLDNLVEGAGLYWHFVDIVWLFLLPLLYMVPRA